MSEQRLIDANAFKECWKPGIIGDTLRRVIDDQPTIDHEILPIVRELREKLKRVTAERDAAVSDMKNFTVDWWENGNGFPCKYCKHQLSNGNCEWKMLHKGSDMCLAHNFVWRGPNGDNHD